MLGTRWLVCDDTPFIAILRERLNFGGRTYLDVTRSQQSWDVLEEAELRPPPFHLFKNWFVESEGANRFTFIAPQSMKAWSIQFSCLLWINAQEVPAPLECRYPCLRCAHGIPHRVSAYSMAWQSCSGSFRLPDTVSRL